MSVSIMNQLTQLQSNTNQQNFLRGQANLGVKELDKNAFLQLLMAQLQNQDPLSPVDNKDFLAQQAQLTQVEKLDNLVSTITTANSLSQVSSLIGKSVELKTPAGQTIQGVVTSGGISDGKGAVDVGGVSYPVEQVSKIFAQPVS
jgi:flagellar basal-body rod modification protein FlgD